MNNKIYKKLFGGFGFVIIVSLLTLFVMSQTYIQNLVYHERLSQMEEVTHQMFRNLEDVIDTHWDEVNVQCNYLYCTPLKTDTEFYRYLKKLSELSNYHERQIELVAVDSDGHYYTENGGMGLLREMNYLADSPQWVSYVSNSLTVDDSRMVFLEKLSTPITLQSGEKEITLRYFGISQSMTQLNDYFRCDAYENSNSVYVLDNNGFKLFNANDTELLKGHNVYTVLSRMSYLHGSSFAEAKERLDRTGSCYSNAVLDGTEYFYALKQMENAQWTLAFLVPAEYVAVNTQKLVNIVMVIIIVIAMMFSVITVFVGWFLLRQKQQQELRTEKEANLRLEQYNIHLTQVNDELRQAQVVAAEALQSAERASKAKTDFLSNMSHDIRTPLNGIIGLIAIDDAHPGDLALITANRVKMKIAANHLLGLINDVLQMSKLESGEVALSHEPLDLNRLSRDILTIVEQRAAEEGVTLEYDREQPERVKIGSVYGSPLHIRQIFLNIYGNCIKYNKPGGSVKTVCQYLGNQDGIVTYRWVIRDTGIGMSEAFLAHIFDPFSQEHIDARSMYHGTGLGMSIVKSLIDKMGGSIEVSSREGEGSEFVITLPFEMADAVPEALEQAEPEKKADVRGLHLLLAEDNELNADIIRTLLADYGITTDTAQDGRKALELFESHVPGTYAGILMDMMMPNMDGVSATRAIRALARADAKTIPIIAMTANAFDEDAKACFEAGMNAHLAKPFQMEKVVAVIAQFCRKA